jgi:hypothetical protein
MPEGIADANVQAGFMLMPDRGAAMLMFNATRTPAQTPVQRAIDEFETFKITNIRIRDIKNSVSQATATPAEPGTAAT